jgi:hypothetical protein
MGKRKKIFRDCGKIGTDVCAFLYYGLHVLQTATYCLVASTFLVVFGSVSSEQFRILLLSVQVSLQQC